LGEALSVLDAAGRVLWVKLIGGGFRVGVSKLLLQRALADVTGVDAQRMAQRLAVWTSEPAAPSAARWQALVAPVDTTAGAAADPSALGLPYPFLLAEVLPHAPDTLGPCSGWLVEWQYDGMRTQLVKRAGQVWVWSGAEGLVTAQFPEVAAAAAALPDGTVLDGGLLVWPHGSERPAPSHLLQQRLNRKRLDKKLLASAPVRFVAVDLLEQAGIDLRSLPLLQRRAALEAVHADWGGTPAGRVLALSPQLNGDSWAGCAALRQGARQRGMVGLMLKKVSACYGVGHTKAESVWWTWMLDPLRIHALLVYAQAGAGGRAGLDTDYTFAVWNRTPASAEEAQAAVEAIARREPAQPGALQLLPVAKAGSGLSDEDAMAADRVIRATTVEKFGPVRSLRPTLVFEIGFEGVNASPRHKSGVALRLPRMLRIRRDKPVHEADALPTLQTLLAPT
jgi:DNA ligase-1